MGGGEKVLRWFKYITFIVHFISIIITFQLHSNHQALDPKVWGPLGRE